VDAAVGRSINIANKRATRMGPLAVMNGGTVFCAPCRVATAICGFCDGLEPPIAG